MGICKIQKPTSNSNHGDIFIKITCDGNEQEPIKYEGDKGDLYVNLVCEEEDVEAFYIGDDCKKELAKIKEKLAYIESGMDGDIDLILDLTEAENYIKNNPI